MRNNYQSWQNQSSLGYQGEVPSRPSSASSFDSYSREHHQNQRSSFSYSSGGNGGGYQRSHQDDGGRRRFDDKVDPQMMSKNAGQLGLDPTTLAPIQKDFYKEHPEVASMTAAQVDEFRRNAQMIITGKSVPK